MCRQQTGARGKRNASNDKGRLSAEEIERLTNEAEKYELGCMKERISAEHRLWIYAQFMQSTMKDGEKKCSLAVQEFWSGGKGYQREALEKAVVQKLCAAVDATEQDLLRAFMINHCPS